MRERACTDLCGGRPAMVVPTATGIVGRVLLRGLSEASERKTTIFRPAKRPVLSVLIPGLFTVRFAWGFPLTVLEPFANRSVADTQFFRDLPQVLALRPHL